MNYTIKKLTQSEALTIAYEWHYTPPYDFYDMEADEEDLAMFIDAEKRGESHFSLHASSKLVGFFSVGEENEKTGVLGLGMHPDMTGKGESKHFLQSILAYIKAHYDYDTLSLSVATFNARAIKAYKNVGFKKKSTFMQTTNGDVFEFVRMKRLL